MGQQKGQGGRPLVHAAAYHLKEKQEVLHQFLRMDVGASSHALKTSTIGIHFTATHSPRRPQAAPSIKFLGHTTATSGTGTPPDYELLSAKKTLTLQSRSNTIPQTANYRCPLHC